MRQRILWSAVVASVLAAAGCKAPVPVTTASQPQTTIAASQLTGTLSTPSVIAVGGGNVIAVGGGNVIATGGGNVIAVGGGNVIATGGGNVIATGGGNVIATGGGNYRIKQAEGEAVSELLLANATVYLADGAGQPYENATATTDGNGRFTFNEVPGGGSYQIVVDLKFADGKTYSLRTLASATEESVTANVDTTSTLVAESLLDGGELAGVDNATFRSALQNLKARLTKADMPDNWTDRAAVKKAGGTFGERFRDFLAEFRARFSAARTQAGDLGQRLRERFRNRTQQPVQTPATPEASAPVVSTRTVKLKLADGFFARHKGAWKVTLQPGEKSGAAAVPLEFKDARSELSAQLVENVTYRVFARMENDKFDTEMVPVSIAPGGSDEVVIRYR